MADGRLYSCISLSARGPSEIRSSAGLSTLELCSEVSFVVRQNSLRRWVLSFCSSLHAIIVLPPGIS